MSNTMDNDYARSQVFLAGVAFLCLSLMALFFLGVSWAAGGDAFLATIFGKETMAMLLAGATLGGGLMLAFRDKSASV